MKATFSYDSIEAAAKGLGATSYQGHQAVALEIDIPEELSWTDDDGKTSEWSFTGKTGTALADGRPTAEYEEIGDDTRIGEGRIFIAVVHGEMTTDILERVNF